MSGLQSLLGIAVFFGIAWLVSTRRWNVRLRPVIGSVLLALLLTMLITQTSGGRWVFGVFGEGMNLLFAATNRATAELIGPYSERFTFVSHVLPPIVVVSAIIGVLYHFRIIQALVWCAGNVTRRLLGISGAEANVTFAEIMFGPQESQLVAKRFLPSMSRSELLTVMVAGLATVAGGVMVAFTGMLSGKVEGIAGHLVAASVMSAILSIALSKVAIPEEREVGHLDGDMDWSVETPSTLIALIDGGWSGLQLCARILVSLLVGYTLIFAVQALLPGVLPAVGGVMQPFAWLMGIPAAELQAAGELLGKRLLLTEFVAYNDFAGALDADPAAFSPRTRLVLSYALCGFCNLLTVAAMTGSMISLTPSRRADIAELAWKALLLATLTTFLTANIAALVVFGF